MPTKIPYVDEAWSPITGCSGDGCKCRGTCWARRMVERFPKLHDDEPDGIDRDFSLPVYHQERLTIPYKWRKPRTVLVSAMGELFDQRGNWGQTFEVFDVMVQCPEHRFYVLTKQPHRMGQDMASKRASCAGLAIGDMPSHIWPGVSCCDQEDADRMIPELLNIDCARSWVSLEPLIGPVDLSWPLDHPKRTALSQLSWVVVGCESGPGRRPCKLEWVEDIVAQCRDAGAKCFVKQISVNGRVSHDPAEWPEELRVQERPEAGNY